MDIRKLNRLNGYDYSTEGSYYVTICARERFEYFGKIIDQKMHVNVLGRIVSRCWLDLPNHYGNCELGKFIIMPDHMHGIINITSVGNGFKPFPTKDKMAEPFPTKDKTAQPFRMKDLIQHAIRIKRFFHQSRRCISFFQ